MLQKGHMLHICYMAEVTQGATWVIEEGLMGKGRESEEGQEGQARCYTEREELRGGPIHWGLRL